MASFTFDAGKHEYRLGGCVIPSVTHITRFLHYDAANGADRVMRQAAADRGSRIHEACLLYDYEGEDSEVDGDIVGFVTAYATFLRDYKPEWLVSERPTYGTILGSTVAGTPDRMGLIDDHPVIVDIKTGASAMKNTIAVAAQTWAYGRVSDHGWDKAELAVLGLKNDGKYTFKFLDVGAGGSAFLCCLTLHNLMEVKRK